MHLTPDWNVVDVRTAHESGLLATAVMVRAEVFQTGRIVQRKNLLFMESRSRITWEQLGIGPRRPKETK